MSPSITSKDIDESSLLASLKAGDKAAVHTWFSVYSPKVSALIAQKVDAPADIDELTQETFISCLKHLPLFRGDSSIWTWMSRVARHEVADYYRKKYAKKALKTLPLVDWLLAEPVHDARETSHRVNLALQRISDHYRELLLLKYAEKMSVKAIAQKMNRSIKSIESDLFRARQAFKLAYAQV